MKITMSKLKEESKNSSPNCSTMLPLALAPPPFFRQAKPNIQLFITSASHVVDQFHKSMLSSADEFLNTVRILASKNPLLSKIIAFSSHVQSFKIPCRKYGTSNSLHNHNFAAILPGDSVAGVVAANGILNFLNLYNTILICRLVLTWFPNAPPAIVSPLSTLCDPYLNIFRGLIPPLGGTLDLSPILAFLVLNAFTSAATALPAELPPPGSPHNLQSHLTESHSTASQKKWMRRLAGGNKPRDT